MGASPKIPRAVREPGIALRYDTTVEGFVGRPRPRSAQRSLGAALTAGSRLVAANHHCWNDLKRCVHRHVIPWQFRHGIPSLGICLPSRFGVLGVVGCWCLERGGCLAVADLRSGCSQRRPALIAVPDGFRQRSPCRSISSENLRLGG